MSSQSRMHVTLRASGLCREGARTELRFRDLPPLVMDKPSPGGPGDAPLSPVESVVGALCACLPGMVRATARRMELSVGEIAVEAEGDWDLSGALGLAEVPAYVQSIRLGVRLATNAAPEELAALRAASEARCPVYCLLRAAGVQIEADWTAEAP